MTRTTLLFLALLTSCEGRCMNSESAAQDELPVGSHCVADNREAICIGADHEVFVCNIDGVFFFKAHCAHHITNECRGKAEAP